jgi:hypothetical protein
VASRRRRLLRPAAGAALVAVACALAAALAGDSITLAPGTGQLALAVAPGLGPAITGISVAGQPVKVWDHTTSPRFFSGIDGNPRAWREASGHVNVLVNALEAHRLRGPDFDHLAFDTNQIYSNIPNNLQTAESGHGFWDFIMGPYSTDGTHFYSLAHSEWYAALATSPPDLVFDPVTKTFTTNTPTDNPNTRGVLFNSWTTTVNSLKSADGGASWQRNSVGGNFTVADTSYHWTGSIAFTNRAYLHAVLYTGLQTIGRMVKEGNHYYAIGNYFHRDFSQINPATGQWTAPVDKQGLILIRTTDFTDPNGWEAWSGGSTWEAVANLNFKTFLPMLAGVPIPAGDNPYQYPLPPNMLDFVFDTVAQVFVVVFGAGTGPRPLYYMTTRSLATPAWSDYAVVAGTATLQVGPVVGFQGNNYIAIVDPAAPGYNFETTSGTPRVFYTAAQDLYYVPLKITYAPPANLGDVGDRPRPALAPLAPRGQPPARPRGPGASGARAARVLGGCHLATAGESRRKQM